MHSSKNRDQIFRNTLNDVNNLAYSVTNAPKEIQEEIESNILYDQYSTPAELIEDLNNLTLGAGQYCFDVILANKWNVQIYALCL